MGLLGCLQTDLDDRLEFKFSDADLDRPDFKTLALSVGKRLVVDVSAVATVQILNQHPVVTNHDDAVLATDRFTLGTQLARFTPPD